MFKLIVGIGNPGKIYKETRHNVGSWYVLSLAQKYQVCFKKNKIFHGYTCNIKLKNEKYVKLLIPNTFMNLCGNSVKNIASFYKISINDILIAHDDLNLIPGNIRIKLGGDHHGHNGIKSIISALKNHANFYRLRIGIGNPGKNKAKNFVLNKPTDNEKKLINMAINKAIQCTKILIIQKNITHAMNNLHKKQILNF
ncbi:Peptidyl-tRNA hydrolase [Candidatus Westeberhardia cardiocondylae]|uniref:Peptidyl-tRNA hydrolase n=1 Tax=Candidatus Westeberhardia cardiocondylae TaxID=1594731 RepID=A0A0H5BWY8_9ENTR|nr:aminoacyl-tRNA hydrolase [Candidatus Westeberhardia cardiocondylae]CEN32237.1 Peptidyl-tRNA hydrolase [Candidatus Westeberhardia cardiocondylae]